MTRGTSGPRPQTPNDAMFAIAQQLGFTKESYDAALTNQALFSGLEALQKQATDEFQLTRHADLLRERQEAHRRDHV